MYLVPRPVSAQTCTSPFFLQYEHLPTGLVAFAWTQKHGTLAHCSGGVILAKQGSHTLSRPSPPHFGQSGSGLGAALFCPPRCGRDRSLRMLSALASRSSGRVLVPSAMAINSYARETLRSHLVLRSSAHSALERPSLSSFSRMPALA